MFKFDKRDAVGSALRTPLERLPTDAGEAFNLAWQNSLRAGNSNSITYGLREEYAPILDDLEKRTGKRLINPANFLGMSDDPTSGKAGYDAQVSKINEFIARNQAEFPDLKPVVADDVFQSVVKKGRAAREEWATASEYAGTTATISGFFGSVAGSTTDPVNIAATAVGVMMPGSRALAPMMGREAGINAVAEAALEPGKREVADTLGFKRDLGDFATDVTGAAVFGAGFAGATDMVGRGFSYMRGLRNSANPQDRSAGIMGERALESLVEDNPSSYVARVASAESGGNLAAKAATSSATGKFQFLESTWNDLANETGVPRVTSGQPDPRLDESFQNAQMEAYTKRSTTALQTAGLDVSNANLYVTHFLGQQGGVDFLKGLQASPNVPAASLVSDEAVQANRSVFFKKDGTARTAQEFYAWASKKVGVDNPTGLPEQHISNYDKSMQAMAEDATAPDPGVIPGKARQPYIEGVELVDPNTLQVDARTFQFKEGGDELGVTDRLKGVEKWEPDFAGIALIYERADGGRFIADGHQRLNLAKRTGGIMNARILREADGWTPEAVRVRAAVKNIAEGTGSPLDAARIMRAAKDAQLPPLPPTSALVRQGRALAELADEPFQMVINGVVPENYGALVGRLIKDPKMQEAAIKVLNKTSPENTTQAEAIVRQVGETDVTTGTQSSLFGDEVITESLYLERAKVMDAALKSLKKDKAVFSTLVNQAERIEGAGNRLSRETNMERMTQDAKVTDYIQKLASRKGPISDALSDAARALKEGGRPGDATRGFLKTVRGAIDDGLDGGSGGRDSGSLADSQRPLEPAEIRAQHDFLEKQPDDFMDDLINGQVDDALADGRLARDMDVYVEDPSGIMVKKKIGAILDDLEADKTMVVELTDCVEGGTEVAV
jgi:hypothetical protein